MSLTYGACEQCVEQVGYVALLELRGLSKTAEDRNIFRASPAT